MKLCAYCGGENTNEIERCSHCGTGFESKESVEPLPLRDVFARPISPLVKWTLYFVAWSIVILVTINRNPAEVLWAPAFPVGLIASVPGGLQPAMVAAWLALPIVMFGGWTFYGVLTLLIGRAKKIGVFGALYVVFGILLALNVAGCRKALEAAAGIH